VFIYLCHFCKRSNKLIYKVNSFVKVGDGLEDKTEVSEVIIPFAQRDMVTSFMEGITPEFANELGTYLENLFSLYPKEIVALIPNINDKEKRLLINKMKDAGNDLLTQLFQSLQQWRFTNSVQPVLNAVKFLPLDELASMAESLVNLTSFKRRISLDKETVGGPIDVAVISKGDGFIWINRKHYFDGKHNPQFYSNYYR